MDFGSSGCVGVGGGGGRGGWVLEAGIAEVDAGLEIGIGGEAFGGDVGCWDAELEGIVVSVMVVG